MIAFRPHHFLCALCFQGKGYSPEFIQNFHQVIDTINQDEHQKMIEVTTHTDAICDPCPHRLNQKCQSQPIIERLDRAHAAALQLKSGELLSWHEAKEKIQRHITLEKFHTICQLCSWKSLGVCESVLSQFLRSDKLQES